MATYTSRLNLKKPDPSDFYNIGDFNENADKIDAKMLRVDDDKASQSDAETGSNDAKWMSPLRTRQSINKLKANQSEAEAGTNDAKWMSPLRVYDLIKAKKCSYDDIIRYSMIVMSQGSAKGKTIPSPSASGQLGFSSGENRATAKITIPLSSLPSDAKISFFQSIDISMGGGSSGGGYTANFTMSVNFGGTSVTVLSGQFSGYNDILNKIKEFKNYNMMAELNKYLSSSDSIIITISQTRVSGNGFSVCDIVAKDAIVRYIQ